MEWRRLELNYGTTLVLKCCQLQGALPTDLLTRGVADRLSVDGGQ